MPLMYGDRHSRAECVLLAKLAEEADRPQDVIKQIKDLIHRHSSELTIDERNLLSVAYKNVTNSLRNSCRSLDAVEKSEIAKSPSTNRHVLLIHKQKGHIEHELMDICKDIIDLLDTRLVPAAQRGEETVFYLKMKGDYYRYLAEFTSTPDSDACADQSLCAYKLAYQHAVSTLEPTHPTRLGLALNFSVFFHDVRKSSDRACHLAKHAFDEAIIFLTEKTALEDALRDSLMIMQLLRDDLILWSSEMHREAA